MPQSLRDEALRYHEEKAGKIEICPKVSLKNKKDLSLSYTPGVAEVSKEIAKDKLLAYKYTIKSNTVAIVTDGSAVLGLGNIGGYAAIPVMEGKSILFKKFGGIDAFPIVFDVNHEDMIEDIKNISPIFGAINLEDIAAPKCFEIEEKLQDIGIPVMHDDQWGTAVVVLAGLINALKVVKKGICSIKIVINGAGAAGTAIAKLIYMYKEPKDMILCDSKGIIYRGRKNLNKYKEEMAQITNKENRKGGLKEAIEGADVFIGVSVGNLVSRDMVKSMNQSPVIFALANPAPEIMPDEAKAGGAAVIATGRSDFENQINNVLAFPGIFRGALDSCAKVINMDMKIAAALALARCVEKPREDYIIPGPFDKRVPKRIAEAVKNSAVKLGCIYRFE